MSIPLVYDNSEQQEYIHKLSQHWNIPLLEKEQAQSALPPFILRILDGKLQLIDTSEQAPGPLLVDFVSGTSAHRRLYGGGKGQMIAKAVGLNKGFKGDILDATAGLGRDAFVLASLGCRITLLERSPIIAALLEDGLKRAFQDNGTSEIIQQMHLVGEDSLTFLTSQAKENSVDIVYLDPMFPDKKGSALVKKEMQYLQQIIGKDLDSDSLLEPAIRHARYRVVVKRPKTAPYLNQQKPQLELKTKGQRFDIYIKQKLPN